MEKGREEVIGIKYYPHKMQKPFHQSTAKHRLFSGGVGSGKTASGANEMIVWGANFPSTYLIMSPTNKMLKNATLAEFFKFCPSQAIRRYNRSEMIIEFENGTKYICLSGETEKYIDRVRGLNLGGYWVDEGSLFPAYLFDVLTGRLREVSGPLKGIITTTQKGKGWIYKYFVEKTHPISFKKLLNPDDFEVFYASSHDNPFTPQVYKDSLEAQYSGAFRRQEIFGEFAEFEGLVYMDFSMNTHVVNIPKNRKFEEVQGWIDWGFKNPMVCLWVGIDGDRRVYVIEEFYRPLVTMDEFISYCERKSREFTNFTKFIADPSEPEHISQFSSHGLFCEEANNAVLPGIAKVSEYLKIQKDGKPRLFVDKDCVNTINEFQMYSYPESREGKPQLEKPVKLYDHCFVKGTKVYTDKGYKPVEKITTEDKVLTRQGFKPVKYAIKKYEEEVYRLKLSNGKELVGTGNHPVWTDGIGFVQIRNLRKFYKVEHISSNSWYPKQQKLLKLMESNSLNRRVNGIIGLEANIIKKGLGICTGTFGKNIMIKKFLRVVTYTILMVIQITTKFLISSAFLGRNICQIMLKAERLVLNITRRWLNLQKNGIGQKKVGNGIVNTEKKPIKTESRLSKNVFSVMRTLGISLGEIILSIVRIGASLLLEGNLKLMMKKGNVFFAGKSLKSISMKGQKRVHVVAVERLEEKQDVYDLNVVGCHEYYANDILVHNSLDCIRYGLMGFPEESEVVVGFSR